MVLAWNSVDAYRLFNSATAPCSFLMKLAMWRSPVLSFKVLLPKVEGLSVGDEDGTGSVTALL